MKERSILFSAPMVRAILAGTKTQTRRIVKPQPAMLCRYEMNGAGTHALHLGPPIAPGQTMSFVPPTPSSKDHRLACPYGAGDRLWVRETWYCDNTTAPNWNPGRNIEATPELIAEWRESLYYRADAVQTGSCCEVIPECACAEYRTASGQKRSPWRPGIHMPRWASRITLEVTAVRVERLQDITDADARAEGVDWAAPEPHGERWDDDREDPREVGYNPAGGSFARDNFRRLWDSINGKRAPWASNPWLWCVSFRRIEAAAGERAA